MKEYKAYIFDMDLTLLNAVDASIDAYKKAYQAVGSKFDETTIIHHLSRPLRSSYAEIINPQGSVENFIKTFSQASKSNFSSLAYYYDDSVCIMDKLKKKNKLIGIVTNRESKNLQSSFALHPEIGNKVDNYVTCDMVKELKPSAEPLLKCIENLGIKPSEAVYIGDAENDYLCAKNAHVDFICIERYDNCDFNCPVIIHSLEEIL